MNREQTHIIRIEFSKSKRAIIVKPTIICTCLSKKKKKKKGNLNVCIDLPRLLVLTIDLIRLLFSQKKNYLPKICFSILGKILFFFSLWLNFLFEIIFTLNIIFYLFMGKLCIWSLNHIYIKGELKYKFTHVFNRSGLQSLNRVNLG